MSLHRMSGADASWLHMDRKTNRLIVTSVMWFDEQLDWDSVRKLLRDRLLDVYPRFTQRVVDRTTSVWWEDVEDFDLDAHVQHATLSAPGGRRELEHFVSAVAGRPLEDGRPLWEMHFVDGYRGSGSALVTRIHHCIADGVALSRVLMSLTDDPTEAALADVSAAETQDGGRWLPVLGRLFREVAYNSTHPGHVVEELTQVGAEALSLTRLLAMRSDAHTALRGKLGEDKSVRWTDPVPLADVRTAAHASSATVNDVVLTAVCGALRSYLARMDGDVSDVRAILPVNLRPPTEPLPAELGNRFGLVFLELPLSIEDPQARLAQMKARTSRLKRSAEAIVSFQILGLTGHTPYAVQQAFVELFATKASAVITNVAGSPHAVFLSGCKVRGTIGWPPESGNLGLGVSIISYDGELTVGILTDDTLIADPDWLLAEIRSGLRELVGTIPRPLHV
ncbi:MAG: wax ester/triacylglycerol synthase family O-acyltransferase [Jatrophihabitans sp.]